MLDSLKQALAATGIPFRHIAWAKAPSGTYGTYQEDGSDSFHADNSVYQQILEGTIDIYTKDDTGAPMAAVQNALTAAGITWSFDESDYDTDMGTIHYQWSFEVLDYGG